MKVIREAKRLLPVPLTDHEMRDAGRQLAATCENIAAEESQQADQKAQMKARLTQLVAMQTQQAIRVRRGADDRLVDVVTEYYEDGMVKEIRTDTGEIITLRTATPEERQLALGDKTEEELGEVAQKELFGPTVPPPVEPEVELEIEEGEGEGEGEGDEVVEPPPPAEDKPAKKSRVSRSKI